MLSEFIAQIVKEFYKHYILCAFFIVAIAFLWVYLCNALYKRSSYFLNTKKTFLAMWFDSGARGEFFTYKDLRSLEKNGARFLFNLYLPKENSQTTEIDLLLLTKQGIFVIESKNYSGWIFGEENQAQWCQVLPAGRGRSQKNSFYNPVLQNKTHIKYLSKVLEEDIPVFSLIVFSIRCELKQAKVESKNVFLIQRDGVAKTVAEICQTQPEVLTSEQIEHLYTVLFPYTQVNDQDKEKHVTDIEKELSMRCPRCHSQLVARKVKKGPKAGEEFYGCSNYPKCKYTKNK